MKVAIIESVSPADLKAGRCEGPELAKYLKGLGFTTSYAYVHDICGLKKAIAKAEKADVVHLSCHANDEGIGLEDNTFIKWEELKGVAGDGLKDRMLSLSSCKGGVRSTPSRLLFQCAGASRLVAPFNEVDWAESLAAFKVYYKGILDNRSLADIACDMNQKTSGRFRIYERTGVNTYGKFPACQAVNPVRRI